MKRSLTILAAAGAAALAGAVAIPLSASAASTSPVQRLTLVETSVAVHTIDVPAPAADGQAGDTSTFESTLSTKAGAKTGRLEGHCIQIRADGTLDDCDVTVTVGAKSFRMSGPFNPTTGGPLTITGGTGDWTGAAGTDTIANQPDGTAVHTITLRLC
ncbi:MAG TPA: hypothetical protein VI248_08285 [Kineosporiaceae bacterium]